jgi:hypothetical protein
MTRHLLRLRRQVRPQQKFLRRCLGRRSRTQRMFKILPLGAPAEPSTSRPAMPSLAAENWPSRRSNSLNRPRKRMLSEPRQGASMSYGTEIEPDRQPDAKQLPALHRASNYAWRRRVRKIPDHVGAAARTHSLSLVGSRRLGVYRSVCARASPQHFARPLAHRHQCERNTRSTNSAKNRNNNLDQDARKHQNPCRHRRSKRSK